MFERTSRNTASQAVGYALFAASLYWLCAVCVTDGDSTAKIYPGLEPGMDPQAAGYSQYQPPR